MSLEWNTIRQQKWWLKYWDLTGMDASQNHYAEWKMPGKLECISSVFIFAIFYKIHMNV
jgi:hypothetical protein